jgi:phosphoribosylamine--glycine ligase
MHFLGVTESCDLAALYMSLQREGHRVKICISEPEARGTLAGLVEQVADWRSELQWLREGDGAILFESVSEGYGALQDRLRADGYKVIGGSAFGDRLENDRAYAQRLLAEHGFQTAAVHEFQSWEAADAFVAAHPRRYVLKSSGSNHEASDTYVGQLSDGADVCAVLAARAQDHKAPEAGLILMDHVAGIEVGIGAYFNGYTFLQPACLDWEHKHFFAGEMGELTGEMGTVVTFERSEKLFALTLERLAPLFREAGHVGYVNINTIVNEQGLWPLEFTCRFGYPGYAILDPLQQTPWADLFQIMTDRTADRFSASPGFCVGILLTTPPFPYSRKQIPELVGLPVTFEAFSREDSRHVHYGEVGERAGLLVTSGLYGWSLVVTGTGAAIDDAVADAYERAKRVHIPRVRYRLDIGQRLLAGDYAAMEELGYFEEGKTSGS